MEETQARGEVGESNAILEADDGREFLVALAGKNLTGSRNE